MNQPGSISVVTPTFRRPAEVSELLDNLSRQTRLPLELMLVDGAPSEETATEEIIHKRQIHLPFTCRYVRHGGGTAIQRNVGIDAAAGEFIAFIDDDIRLEPDFFANILDIFAQDHEVQVGGVIGYISNQHLDAGTSARWRWYRKLRLFSTYEPGRYDYATGYPINRYLQPPYEGVREIDFMSANCAVWRRKVFASGLRFAEFFRDYGVLEDAHLSLRAGRQWKLLECGQARCVHLRSPRGRVDTRRLAKKTAVNYRFVFVDLVPRRTWLQEIGFWRLQVFDLFRICAKAVRTRSREDWMTVVGKAEGIWAAGKLKSTSP